MPPPLRQDELRILQPEELRQLHTVQLDLLLEFDRLCRRLGLRYQIAAGTLLGAVRHGGFIPWDDDIDVILRREDYRRLLRLGPALLADRFFLQSRRSDPEYRRHHAKLRRHGSVFREIEAAAGSHAGIFIDIFPFDPVAPRSRLWRWRCRLLCRLNAVLPRWWGPLPRELLLRAIAIRGADARGADQVVCLASGPLHLGRILAQARPVAEFEQTVWLGFAGLRLPATAAFDRALTRLYGAYRTPPPPERRVPGHPVREFRLPEPPLSPPAPLRSPPSARATPEPRRS
jgi:lipopolysaccharide cholinephosphotransferase